MPAPRVRFCPAPSGWLHVGSARTALFNWLHARHGKGAFVFRIEDTDAERATDESMTEMIAAVRFLGLDWDEGPEVGGPHGPYRQSERSRLYAAVAAALLEAGHAYDAYETAEELAAEREAAQRAGLAPGYQGGHRDLTDSQRAAFRAEGRRPVVRVRTPDEGTVAFDDAVRGRIAFAWKDIGDFVVQRADGSATYFLANTADDLAMGIDFIARGEDLLSATPRQLLLADLLLGTWAAGTPLIDRALADNDFPARPAGAQRPAYAHLPLMVGEDRKKLSKRHGSVAVDEYRRQGYLPDVLVNFLALCGWSYDATTEAMTVDELIERFSFDRVGSNPALFDTAKLRAMNGDRIKQLGGDQLAERLQPFLADLVAQPPEPKHQALLLGFAPLVRERIQTLAEAVPLIGWAFRGEVRYDHQAVATHLKGVARDVLDAAEPALAGLGEWSEAAIMGAFEGIGAELGLGRGKVMMPVRVAVSGSGVTPPLPESLALLDRTLVVARVRAAKDLVAA
ncbi:MAG: glutamate--tRNA ligase [Egibacteraceae bacterium]